MFKILHNLFFNLGQKLKRKLKVRQRMQILNCISLHCRERKRGERGRERERGRKGERGRKEEREGEREGQRQPTSSFKLLLPENNLLVVLPVCFSCHLEVKGRLYHDNFTKRILARNNNEGQNAPKTKTTRISKPRCPSSKRRKLKNFLLLFGLNLIAFIEPKPTPGKIGLW